MSDTPKLSPEELLKGLFFRVQGVLQSAQEIALTGAGQVRRGVFPHGTGFNGVYGFTVKADVGRPSVTVEPFGNLRTDASGQPVVQEYLEPRTELTEDAGQYLIVAEVPGVAAQDVKLNVAGSLLTFTAERGGRRYRKEVALPADARMDQVLHACLDGLLEIRIAKTTPASQAGTAPPPS